MWILTIHLGCGDVELIRDDAGESRHEQDQDVSVAVEESVCPDQEDALCGDLVPHRQSNRNLCTCGRKTTTIEHHAAGTACEGS